MFNYNGGGIKFDLVITSPPYNTSRKGSSLDNACANIRYDEFDDCKTDKEYIDWTLSIFNSFDNCLNKNGVVIYNLSYSSENTYLMWLVVAEIINNTNFTVADNIVWKKLSASPNSCSPNKLTRICEYVFIFCRKNEINTFHMNKEKSSVRETGQIAYKNYFNFIEERNNDGCNRIHKATFSSHLVRRLLHLYAKPKSICYDPFMGTGTTAYGCIIEDINFIGSEISKRYCEIAEGRIKVAQQPNLFTQ